MITDTVFAAIALPEPRRRRKAYIAVWTAAYTAREARNKLAGEPPFVQSAFGARPSDAELKEAWKKARAAGWRIAKVAMTVRGNWERRP